MKFKNTFFFLNCLAVQDHKENSNFCIKFMFTYYDYNIVLFYNLQLVFEDTIKKLNISLYFLRIMGLCRNINWDEKGSKSKFNVTDIYVNKY